MDLSANVEPFVERRPTPTTNPLKIDVNQTLFVCGYDRGRLKDYLFPEFGNETTRLDFKTRHDENSFLVFGLCGPCPSKVSGSKPPRLQSDWVQSHWKGTALFFNGEGSYGPDARGNNTFQIGLVEDSDRSVHVLFLAMAFIGHYKRSSWKHIFQHSHKPQSEKSEFLIYVASNCVDYREEAFDRLSAIHPPGHQGGRCGGKISNDTGLVYKLPRHKRVPSGPKAAGWAGNSNIYMWYRFCLVMENENTWGYVTEKILNAFLGGCIPIYYGTEEIFDVFNHRAFVYYNISDPQPAIDRVRYLENNRTAYDQVVRNEPILANGEQTINDYFSLGQDVGDGSLMRKIRDLLGLPREIVVANGTMPETASIE